MKLTFTTVSLGFERQGSKTNPWFRPRINDPRNSNLGGVKKTKTTKVPDPFRFVLLAVAGWMNQYQQDAIDYQREENRTLREQLDGRRLRLNDDQRHLLASKAKRL
jgi:hypothetical protein